MSKQSKIIGVVVVLLIAIIAITAYFNMGNVEEKTALNNSAIFMIKSNDEIIKEYTMTDIQALGEKNFEATKDTSKSGPESFQYTGVPLLALYEDAGVEVKEGDTIVNTAADGYSVALAASKVLDIENVYIAYKRDGELLGTHQDGGVGPYLIIVSKDQFSQYWCKFALSTEVQ